MLGFPCSHILAACHCRLIDFQQFVQRYYTTRAYLSTWAPLFYPIFYKFEWPQYNGPIIVPSNSMKHVTSDRPKSSCLHNEMDARETRTPQTCRLCKQSSHNRQSFPNRETNDKSNWCTSWTSYCTIIFLFININLNRFKIYVETILLNIFFTFVC